MVTALPIKTTRRITASDARRDDRELGKRGAKSPLEAALSFRMLHQRYPVEDLQESLQRVS
jgi:hypothetical protein